MTIPVEVDEITPAWLSHALGAPVVRVDVLDRHSGTTGRARIAVEYGDHAAARPATMFVKLAPFDVGQRGFVDAVGLGVSEARFYRDVAREIPLRIPAVWHAALDGEGRYVMVLEDLVASGCRFPRPRDADAAERARSIVEDLAALHARFWESARFGADLAWVDARRTGDGGDAGRSAVERVLDHLADHLPQGFREFAAVFLPRAGGIPALWNEGPCTLVHGDPHLGNLFVDGARTGFLDWAMVSAAPGLRDVAYALCSSFPPAVCEAHERALVGRYVECLAAGGVALDVDTAWRQYRLFAIYAWVAATSTAAMGSLWQPERIGYGGMQRATAALVRLDAAALLRERLDPD